MGAQSDANLFTAQAAFLLLLGSLGAPESGPSQGRRITKMVRVEEP